MYNYLTFQTEHPNEFSEYDRKKKERHAILTGKTQTTNTTLQSVTCPVRKYRRDDDIQKEIDQYILRFITEDCVPLRTVDKRGFRALVGKLNPMYNIPSRKTITTRVSKEAQQVDCT